MKNLLIAGIVLLSLASCSKPNHLIGKWELTDIDYERHFETLPEELQELFRGKMEEEFARLKGKTFFVFKEDQSLELIAPNFLGKSISEKGKYSLNEAKDSVFFDISIDEYYHIDSLGEKILILSTDEIPKRTLTLTK